MFRQLSKITLKYTGSLFSHDDHPDFTITPKLIESWLKDIQTGLVRCYFKKKKENLSLLITNK